MVVNVDETWILDFFRDHLWQEVAQQHTHSFNVLFTSKEDFFACDCRLPQGLQHFLLILVEDALVQHQAVAKAFLDLLKVHLVGLLRLCQLATRVLAVDEDFDG